MTLQDRDVKILKHVARFGMAIPPGIHRLLFPDLTLKAVERVTTRLIRARSLRSYPLFQQRVYYRLSPAATRLLGQDGRLARPLRIQALIRAYGTYAFCCLGGMVRRKLTPGEFREKFAEYDRPELPTYGYYLDEERVGSEPPTVRLGLILVDHGADYGRIVRKCRRAIHRRLEVEAFRRMMREKRFVIAVVTGTEDKRSRLNDALRRESGDVLFRVETVPDLARLLE